MTEWIVDEDDRDHICEAISPSGWYCCPPLNHDGNHVGTTKDFGSLSQWPADR